MAFETSSTTYGWLNRSLDEGVAPRDHEAGHEAGA
jgi:hypothetical protein